MQKKSSFKKILDFFKYITYRDFLLYSRIIISFFCKIRRSLLYATLHLAFALHLFLGIKFTASVKDVSLPKCKIVIKLYHSLLANRQLPVLPSFN